ncbi:hypothetical protein ANO11243_014470 [Dothideomycetidae sp. 11243]|nr:hypothetical protein ANO11243_014470 [fungal sp. No.11243]
MARYSEDPKWADVTPFPQDDGGPNPLAAISYTEGYAEAMAYLRAVMASNEMSPRALELTEDIIGMNPAHYTVWLYRARIITHLSLNLHDEITWLNTISLLHPKNYQIWHHRQAIIDRLDSAAGGEIAFINQMLAEDAKNYHVWSYRQWLVRRFALWESSQVSGRTGESETTELRETELFLERDVRNNSAWNHRFFVVHARLPEGGPDAAVVEREMEFAKAAIRRAPNNQSPWAYLRGVVERDAHGKKGIIRLQGFCEEFVSSLDRVRSSHALQLLAEIYALTERKREARDALDLLASAYDPIRVNYWRYLKGRLDKGPAGDGVVAS